MFSESCEGELAHNFLLSPSWRKSSAGTSGWLADCLPALCKFLISFINFRVNIYLFACKMYEAAASLTFHNNATAGHFGLKRTIERMITRFHWQKKLRYKKIY